MESKVLTLYDLGDLNRTAEEVITTAQFRFWEIDEDGNHIVFGTSSEERHVRLLDWVEESKNNYLCFRMNEELHQIRAQEALNMTFSEAKERYLKRYLKKLRNILRKDTLYAGVIVPENIPDSYLDDLLAMKWLDALRLWAVQWDESWGRVEGEETNEGGEQNAEKGPNDL